MTSKGRNHIGDLPAGEILRVNKVCNRFEELWQSGRQPKVEEMLDEFDASCRDVIVHELLPLEIEYLRRAGVSTSLPEVQSRFPNLDQKWLAGIIEGEQEEQASTECPRVISHYRLEARLGVGGMGEVYRARDVALGRDCAVKILANRFSPSLRARMVREASINARLQHPSIATFYESGEEDGESFIAMELVQGQTLRNRLADGPLLVDETINLAASLLEALGHAHAVGILHRDVKPENVMLTAGAVKLLDFGLAKELESKQHFTAPTLTMLTGEGAILGTVGYMPPEQLRGEDLDERVDVFSVGAVVYEALTGRPAFPGATSTERIASIFSKDPEPIVGAGVSDELNTVLQKAMSRDPAQRYLSVAAFLVNLRQVGTGELKSGVPDRLIVADFVNLSGNTEDDWIGAGVAETLCSSLSHVKTLTVVPREKALRIKAAASTDEPQTVGLKLGCRWSVTGNYQKIGAALRFTIRLSELLTGEVVMSEQLDGNVATLFAMQDQLAMLVQSEIGEVTPSKTGDDVRQPRISAFECYVKGRQAWMRTEKGKLDRAQEWFQQAVDIEPAYGLALSGLAAVNALRFTYMTEANALDVAEEYARRAIEADPLLSEPHVWLGYIHLHRGELESAYEEEQTAIRLDPENFQAHYFAACFVYSNIEFARKRKVSGNSNTSDPHSYRREKGLELFQRALELDNQYGWAWLGAGMIHLDLENFSESQWCIEKAIELEQTQLKMTAGAEGCLAECLRRSGDYVAARAHCLNGINALDDTDNIYRDTFRAAFLCTLGRTAMALHDLDAARTGFKQAVLHSEGRNRARAIGHPYVQALSGLAETDQDQESFRKAVSTYRDRAQFDFSWFWCCSDDLTLSALTRGAIAVGEFELARQFHREAIDCGSVEAAQIQIP